MLGKDSAKAGDDAIGVQAHAAGQGVGQGVLAEQGAGIAVGAAGAGVGGAVGIQQQDVAAVRENLLTRTDGALPLSLARELTVSGRSRSRTPSAGPAQDAGAGGAATMW